MEQIMYDIRDRAAAVRQIQRFLISVLYAEGLFPILTVDGIYGEETKEAIRSFQRKEGLEETGVVNLETWQLLFLRFQEAEEAHTSDLFIDAAFPLRLGDSGSHISLLQTVVNEILHEDLPLDGFYSKRTEDAVRKIEARYGMRSKGEVTKSLWNKIASDYRQRLQGTLYSE
ncbi:MAG: peptidoglycan-binding protein [Clostridia bacterium]|nr:peptidoglycan-binding protein [Clostridia bacterium]